MQGFDGGFDDGSLGTPVGYAGQQVLHVDQIGGGGASLAPLGVPAPVGDHVKGFAAVPASSTLKTQRVLGSVVVM